jgi:uncharacterized protein (TIGR03435 family)
VRSSRCVCDVLNCIARVCIVTMSVGAPATSWSSNQQFEAASIHQSPPAGRGFGAGCKGGPGSQDPTRIECGQMSLMRLLVIAFGVKTFQVSGPDWLRSTNFDISAILPASTTKEEIQIMWQKLLSDRFHLELRHEERQTTVFDLVVAKGGAKLKLAGQATTSNPLRVPGVQHAFMRRETMDDFANFLAELVEAPVRNRTELTDEYEIRLGWTPELSAAVDPNGPTLMQAVEDELGLHLTPRRGTGDFLLIDHIDRVPTDN